MGEPKRSISRWGAPLAPNVKVVPVLTQPTWVPVAGAPAPAEGGEREDDVQEVEVIGDLDGRQVLRRHVREILQVIPAQHLHRPSHQAL